MNIKSLISLWNHTQQHAGTSGARVCAAVLLALYNGARFPMDITDLRILDGKLFAAAFDVIYADSKRCVHEVHQWLNMFSCRTDFGDRFEALAFEYKTFKRGCVGKRGDYAHITRLVIDEPELIDETKQVTLPSIQEVRKAFDMDAHHRAESTPFFNDLAG